MIEFKGRRSNEAEVDNPPGWGVVAVTNLKMLWTLLCTNMYHSYISNVLFKAPHPCRGPPSGAVFKNKQMLCG